MQKRCDFCSKRIGLFSSQAHEADKDGLCLCKKCYASLWERLTDSTSQVKKLASLALSGKLRPKAKSIVAKHLRELVSSKSETDDSRVATKSPNNEVHKFLEAREKVSIKESETVVSSIGNQNIESLQSGDIADLDVKPEAKGGAKMSQEQNPNGEPIVISYDRLCEIEKELCSQVQTLWDTFGHYDLSPFSIEEKSLYEQIKNLDENERNCYLINEAETSVFLYFRELLNHSSGIEEKIILPLSGTMCGYSDKPFLFYPEELIKFIQYQHENINFVQTIKKNPSILNEQFKKSGSSDFETFKRDMIFLSVQETIFCESLLDFLGVVITERDDLGRISNIRYNE